MLSWSKRRVLDFMTSQSDILRKFAVKQMPCEVEQAKERMEPLEFTHMMNAVTLVNQKYNNTAAVRLTA